MAIAVISALLSATLRLFQFLLLLEKLLGIASHWDMSGLILHYGCLPHFNLVKLHEIPLHITLVSMKTVMKHKRRNVRAS